MQNSRVTDVPAADSQEVPPPLARRTSPASRAEAPPSRLEVWLFGARTRRFSRPSAFRASARCRIAQGPPRGLSRAWRVTRCCVQIPEAQQRKEPCVSFSLDFAWTTNDEGERALALDWEKRSRGTREARTPACEPRACSVRHPEHERLGTFGADPCGCGEVSQVLDERGRISPILVSAASSTGGHLLAAL